MITNEHSTDKEVSPQNNRLPCRGYTKNCSDYNRCNGKPWRLINNKNSSRGNNTLL